MDQGLNQDKEAWGWFDHRLQQAIPIPVPASYNDLYEGEEFRDHTGQLLIKDVRLWQPLHAYLYSCVVELWQRFDTYEQPFGVRTVAVKDGTFLINGNPFYQIEAEELEKMKAVVIKGPGEAMLTELERPTLRPDDVLIRSRAVGICGSDLELYRGIRPVGYYRYPIVPGHEWAGEISAVGEQVRNLVPGDKVVAEGFLSCGTCRNCRLGLNNLCQAGYEEIGFTRTGGLAEYVVVPARQVHVLPPDASFEQAALLEPTSVVAHAFLQKRPLPGDTVVVVGDGTIGLLAVQIAHLFNPANLVLLGSRPDRLELGRQLGATHMLNSKENDPEPLIHNLTGGQGANIVFEGGNRPEGIERSILLVRRGGTVLLEGISGEGARLNVESDIFVLKHLTVMGIFGASSAAWTYAVQMFRAGLLNLAPLITHRFALAEYPAALETLMHRQPKTLKVVIVHDRDQEGREQ